MKFTPNMSKTEWKRGLTAMALAMLIVPSLLTLVPGLEGSKLEFAASLANCGAAVWFLRSFLGRNISAALDRPLGTLYLAALGYLAVAAFERLTVPLVYLLLPDYVNLNNEAVLSGFSSDLYLMVFTTVVLAPIGEECFFRGLLFRGIYDRSPAAAWICSVGLFAAIHVLGFLWTYSPMELLASMLIYIPSGIILCVTYHRSGNIIAPILAHSFVNLSACINALR